MSKGTLPKAHQRFAQEQPEIMDRYEHLGVAVMTTGSLDRKTAPRFLSGPEEQLLRGR